MRAFRQLVVALVTAGLVAGVVAASATAGQAARVRRGELTAIEYRQLGAELIAFRAAARAGTLTWSELYAACRKVGEATALLRTIRGNCDTGVGVEQALAGFNADALRCAALTQTTTGTTSSTTTTATPSATAALTSSELSLIACLEPEYVAISRGAGSLYRAQSALRRQVLRRGFSGRCLITLAPTVVELRREHRFLSTSTQLTHDVRLISRVSAGTLPASALNVAQTTADAKAFVAAGRAVVGTHRPQNLAVCPHA